ncbi:type 4a pilus biogenesis protein PilO [Patescibacteria group bacterium]|nr:type 4a pilus biogenesis protein PilO [Patescibacteria group bacterium]
MKSPNPILNKNTLILAISFLAILVLICYIYPAFSLINEAKLTLDSKRAELEYTQKQNTDFALVKSSSEQIEERIEVISNLYVNGLNALDFISFLEEIATEIGLPDPGINMSVERISEQAATIPIQITLSGSFDKVINYLSQLEQSDYLIIPGEITMTKSGDGLVTTQIMSNTYWRY